jgi:hypothetical protein
VGTLPSTQQPTGNGDKAISYLDAGAVFTMKGPNGTKALAKQPTGYSSQVGAAPIFPGQPDPGPPYIVPGDYTFDNGAGGKDIGPFKLTFTMVQPMVWSNADALMATGITRSQGLDINWTPGGDPEALISVGGSSRLANSQVGGLFSCTVKEKDAGGHLNIPAIVLLALPASGIVNGNPSGVLTVTWSSVAPLPLPELDQGNMGAFIGVTRPLAFK